MKKVLYIVPVLICLLLAAVIPGLAQTDSKGTIDEIINLGTTVHGPPTYGAVAGRLVSQTAAYRAQAGVPQMSFIFPAPGAGRSIATARIYLISNSGYTGTATLHLIIYTLDGTAVHEVTSAGVDLLGLPVGSWSLLSLSADTNNLYISPGEFLAAEVTLDPAPVTDGEFDARAMFEILTH